MDSDKLKSMSIRELKNQLNMVEENYDKLMEVHLKLVTMRGDDAKTHDKYLAKVEDSYMITKNKIGEQLEEKGATTHAELVKNGVANRGDPLAGIFSGDFASWPKFRKLFEINVHEKDIPDNVKHQELRRSCIGHAAKVLGKWSDPEANYDEAWDRLCSVYKSNYLIKKTYIHEILKNQRLKSESSKGILDLIKTITKAKTQLDSMGEPVSGWDLILIHIIMENLPSDTFKSWERQWVDDKEPTLKTFLEFLKTKAQNKAERGHEKAEVQPSRSRKRSSPFHGDDTASQPEDNNGQMCPSFYRQDRHHRNDLKCPQCGSNHRLYHCHIYKNMSIEDRQKMAQGWNICRICLRDNHVSEACRNSNQRCPFCGDLHSRLLCSFENQRSKTAGLSVKRRNISEESMK